MVILEKKIFKSNRRRSIMKVNTSFDMFIETEVPYGEMIISRTDLDGNITYVNETFAFISGYGIDGLIGKPHNVIRHPDMPKSAFKDLWETLKRGDIWKGYVKNLRSDGGYYWVFAEISEFYKNDELIGYKSLRSPVEEAKKLEMQDLYDKLRADEEDSIRVTAYINKEQLEKLKNI
jgi:aerotaxis receptor